MGDSNQLAGALPLRFALQRRDPVFRDDVMYKGPQQGADGPRRERWYDA